MMKKRIIETIKVLLLAGMFGFGGYPFIADAWNRYIAKKTMTSYETVVQKKKEDESITIEKRKAEDYNKELYSTGGAHIAEYTEKLRDRNKTLSDDGLAMKKADDPEYESILNINNDGIMGELEIPKIDLRLPISHYSTAEVLADGIGHLYGSSLPIGGINSHAVLTGHRGLPTMELFTYLDKLKKWDRFYIHILGETHTYQVVSIDTVLPEEVNELGIHEGKDLVTLVTCTPYAVNTHRLLVTGERIPGDRVEEKTTLELVKSKAHAPLFMIATAVIIALALFIRLVFIWKPERKEKTDIFQRF